MSANAAGVSAAFGDAPLYGDGMKDFCTGGSKDWEVDHGEEIKVEEEIREKEEGRSGPQKEDAEGQGEEDHEKESGEEGCSQAQGRGAKARACSHGSAGARSVLAPARRLGFRWRR